MYLVFDTETTGLPKQYNAPITDTNNWPRCVQLAWQLHDTMGKLLEAKNYLIQPDGFEIPYNAQKIHGISTELAQNEGKPLKEVLQDFNRVLEKSQFTIGHNVDFDVKVMACEFHRVNIKTQLHERPTLDSCSEKTAELCQIETGRAGKFKFPKLEELYQKLFGEKFDEAHNAAADVAATARAALELIRQGVFSEKELLKDTGYLLRFNSKNPNGFLLEQVEVISYKKRSEDYVKQEQNQTENETQVQSPYVHIHNHSQYSILAATSTIEKLVHEAVKQNMPAVGLTDLGNMYGAFQFVEEINKVNQKITPENKNKPLLGILGIEIYLSERYKQNKFTKNDPDRRYKQLLLAKNKQGYQNLIQLSNIGFIEGYYSACPRVSKEIILKYKEHLIALVGGPGSELFQAILDQGEQLAEKQLLWWKKEFHDDLYIEMNDHGLEEERYVNQVLLKLAEKHNIKYIAQNNTFYIHKKDAKSHDALLCIKDGELQNIPVGKGRGYRFGYTEEEYYFKSQEAMKEIFRKTPEAIRNLQGLLDKIENFSLKREVLLPKFQVPKKFQQKNDPNNIKGQHEYLKYLSYQGAKKRYHKLTDEIKERLDFELDTIAKTGYPGYFLVIQDLIAAAREMGVLVGPGRGSAAGSVVAYCTEITNIDPIKYKLLFERFLNPDRVSLPDIDIDFDDEGRAKIIKWVEEKYGHKQVAQIITYGTLGGKSALRDSARVMSYPLDKTNLAAKLLPNVKLEQALGVDDKTLRANFNTSQYNRIKEFKALIKKEEALQKVVAQAKTIEGAVRNTGLHACGLIITPNDITQLVPVTVSKDSDLLVTQFDNRVVEDAGLLKMDFLGLKTLSLIKKTVKIIEEKLGIHIKPDLIPLDDKKTYELFQQAETIGIFQYESEGMRRCLRELKPTVFSDLIAMNALYRPGPMEYIPQFIARKHGREQVSYDLKEMEEYLNETYGITVYQEQVMLLSQVLADFTKGEADLLRKAMGKKIATLLNELKPKFISGAKKNGHPEKILEKIWHDWEAFASYAFNKSHSTCYAWIAYQTAYLKANFPSAYMTAILSNNMNHMDNLRFFMEECKRMKLPLLGPDLNESDYTFTSNEQGSIRFGLGAIKGVGEHLIESIIHEREERGAFSSIFDMGKRLDHKVASKKLLEAFVFAGVFDSFGYARSQYFYQEYEDSKTIVERAVQMGKAYREKQNSSQASLFEEQEETLIQIPEMPQCQEFEMLKKLNKEREILGLYITGHPLDQYQKEFQYLIRNKLSELSHSRNKKLKIGAIITHEDHRVSKNGNPWGIFTLEDFSDSYELKLFGDSYAKHAASLVSGNAICVTLSIVETASGFQKTQIEKIIPLSSLLEQGCKKLTLNVELQDIDEDYTKTLETIIQEKGQTSLFFAIYDSVSKNYLQLLAKDKKIKVNAQLLEKLEDNKITFQL